MTTKSMNELKSIIKNGSIRLLIWDFDGVIFKLDWKYQSTPAEFLEELYEEINKIDNSIIKDKDEFISRLFPYPEINEVGIRHGKKAQDQVKFLYAKKESAALHRAIPNQQIIDFIRESKLSQAVWSNNLSSTIEYLLKEAGINNRINHISTFDKVIQSKPHIEGFEIIKNAYPETNTKNILLVGDSLISDKAAAENTGINFYHYARI
jgi:FMN phosphatase YigB (HAD superfamily)